MKTMDSRQSPLAAQVLKLVGIVLILFFFVEILVFLIAPQVSNPQWQLSVMTQLVERGVTPLVGFALIYTSFGMQSMAAPSNSRERGAWLNPQFWAFVISSLLGLIFLLLIPLHVGATNQASEQAITRINQQAGQTELQLEQEQSQLQALVKSGQLDQLIQSNRVPPEQLPLLQQLKQNPQALTQRTEEARKRIRSEQNQAQQRARTEALSAQLRTGLRSLLLAIGYITIGWTGLREAR